MNNSGKSCGKYWGKLMESVRRSRLKSGCFTKAAVKGVKNGSICALDLHKLLQECEKEMMDYKIRIAESTVST